MRSPTVKTLLAIPGALITGALIAGASLGAPAADPYVVRGQVVTREGALAGAEVRLIRQLTAALWPKDPPENPDEPIRTESGNDGRFEIAVDLALTGDRRSARWLLEVSAPGLARRNLEIPPPGGQARAGAVAELGGILLAPGAVVRGRAADESGEPLADVRVALWSMAGSRPWSATSGDDGGFAVTDVAHGEYAAVLDRQGYVPVELERVRVHPAAGGNPAGPADLGTIRLQRTSSLRGRIVNPEGEPLAGVRIRYRHRLPAAAARDRLPAPETESGPRGEFRLDGMPPEPEPSFRLRFDKEGYRRRPGELDFERVDGGVRLAAPIVLELELVLAGRVSRPDGTPIAGATVYRHPADRAGAIDSRATRADGSFRFAGVEAGGHRLEVLAPGFGMAEAEVEVRAGNRAGEPLRITLEPVETRDLTLTVRDAGGDPVAGAEIFFHFQGSESTPYNATLSTDSGGRGLLDHVPVGGPYSLEVRHPEHPRWWRTDLEVGDDQTVLEVDLDPAPWELVTVRGRVSDSGGKPLPGAEVGLVPASETLPRYRVRTDGAGRFELRRVKEGAYRLTAAAPGRAMAALPLRVDADLEPVEVELGKGATLRGEVIGLGTEDLARLRIHADRHRVSDFREAIVDGDSYRVENLGAGKWSLRAWAETQLEAEIEIEPGQDEAWHDFEFPRFYRLRGQLLIDGRAPANAYLSLSTSGEGAHQSYRDTDRGPGCFAFDRVPAGVYQLSVLGPPGSIGRQLSVEADVELLIEARTASLRGRVIDAGTGGGVAEARVQAFPGVAMSHGPEFRDVSGPAGWFEIGPVFEGSWSLLVEATGYLDARRPVEVATGAEPAVVELTASAGLYFRVETAGGRLPYAVTLELRDAAGKRVAMDSVPLQGTASGHWAGAPPGRFRLRASDELTWIGTEVEIPGPEVALRFPPAGTLRLRVPELALESDWRISVPIQVEATLELADDPSFAGPRIRRSRTLVLHALAPGRWRAEVRAADGRVWRGEARVFDGRSSEAVLALE